MSDQQNLEAQNIDFQSLTIDESLKAFTDKIDVIISNIDNLREFENYVRSQTFYYEQFEKYYLIILNALIKKGDIEMIIKFICLDVFDSLGTSYKFNLLARLMQERAEVEILQNILTALINEMITHIPEDSKDRMSTKNAVGAIKFMYNSLSLTDIELLLSTKEQSVFEIFLEDYILKALLDKYKERFVELTIKHANKWLTHKFHSYQSDVALFTILGYFEESQQRRFIDLYFTNALKPENRVIELAVILWKRFNLAGKNKRFDWIVNTFGVNIDYTTYELIGEGLMGKTLVLDYPFSTDRTTIRLNGESLKQILTERLEADFEDVIQLNERGSNIIQVILEEQEGIRSNSTYTRFLLMYISKKIRFDDSEWFSGSVDDLVEILQAYKEMCNESEIKESTRVKVRKSKGQTLDQEKITEEARLSFTNVVDSLRDAFTFVKRLNQKSLNEFMALINQQKETFDSTALLKEFFGDLNHYTGLPVGQLVQRFREFNPENDPLVSLQNAILFLKQLKLDKALTELQYSELLTKYLFVLTLMINPNLLQEAERILQDPKLNYRSIAWVLSFIQHIALEETSKLLITKLGVQSYVFDELKKIIPLENLNSILYTAIDIETEGSTEINFEIRRDLVSEFSGQIADACWAGREEESILFDYTNIETLTIKVGNTFIGSCILIHSINEDGLPVLIIRGINPRETEINKISINQFISKLTEFVIEYARKKDEIPLIVIDDHVGGAATNRPKVFGYLSAYKDKLTKYTKLKERMDKEDKPTVFNGYYIEDNVYSLSA